MKKWLKYVTPYKKYFILGPLCMIVEVIGEVVMPKLLSTIINAANAGTLTVGGSLGIMGLMVLTAVLMMAGGVGGAYFGAKASVSFAADVRSDLYARIQTFSFANIDKFAAGSLVTRLTNDVTQMQNFINMLLRMALRAPGMMIAALIMAIAIKPSLSLVFAVSIPLMLLTIGAIVKLGFPRFGKMQTKVDNLNSTVRENVTNVRVVKSFVREGFETEKFRRANGELKEAGLSAMRVVILISPVMTVFMNATLIAVILIGGPIVLKGGMAIGDLSAFLTYVTQILSSLLMVTLLLMITSRAIDSAKRIREVLDEVPDIADPENGSEKEVVNGSVELKHVTFRYFKESPEPVLKDISLSIPAGATVGIIGSTGSGKSTLVSLIARLYDPDEGTVLVDGADVKSYSLKKLRDGIGMVLQQNTLFSGTVAENLRWGDENATDEQLAAAAETAQAARFIESFPGGYQTAIHKGGSNVSGGQKQRLCIARALLKKPKILILDDSTSAVDTATEAHIRAAFRNELKASTKIIIAQRISSVQDADCIIVMDNGRITGQGTHEQLLKTNTAYREIYHSQTGKED